MSRAACTMCLEAGNGALARALLMLLGTLAVACSKPCEVEDARCEGKNLRTCGHACSDCDYEWLPAVACTGACIAESELRAFCSLTPDLEPLCANRQWYCAADLQVHCRAGYPVSQDRCEPPPGVAGKAECVELPSGLACHASGTGPPRDAGAQDGEMDARDDASR